MEDLKVVAYFLTIVAIMGLVSYALALAREPQAYWMWHDILGVL